MSGPIRQGDLDADDEMLAKIEARQGRDADVGGLAVSRVLPTKGRRTVGAWCFVDIAGPADAHEPDPMEVGPHPHIGLATLTWILEGEALHSDSLGTEQMIRPGQVNLMTAGHGIAHAELAAEPPFHAVQMWIAQPSATRDGGSAFEHHEQLPQIDVGNAAGTVITGQVGGIVAPTRSDTPLVGIDLTVRKGGCVVPTVRSFEHAVIPLDSPVKVGPEVIDPGWIGLVPPGIDELPIDVRDNARMLVLGGEPLGERIEMWWNFVARDRAEIEQAYLDWQQRTDRFGTVTSVLDRIEAPRPPWMPAS